MEISQSSDRPDIIDPSTRYSFNQFCELCRMEPEVVILLVEEGVIIAEGRQPATWTFSFQMVKRLKRAYRLQRDLELNISGVALSVELLEEIDQLRDELARLRSRLETLA